MNQAFMAAVICMGIVAAAQQHNGGKSLAGARQLWQLGGGTVAAVDAASEAGRQGGLDNYDAGD